jgi:DNA oxidative demethylase
MTLNLFDSLADVEQFGRGATVLRQFAVPEETALLSALQEVVATAPFHHMITPGGFLMARCDEQLWFARLGTDRTGCRYDPSIRPAWPQMPDVF